jgi:LuxR family transcriptional regulator, maltose regulon positive regulatory protein
MNNILLRTKLTIPPTQTDWVSRSRLIQHLNEGIKGKLIIVSAPAGFGKTTLLSEWAGNSISHSCWFSIERSDNDPYRFWIQFIASIQNAKPLLGKAAMEMLQTYSLSQPSMESCLNSLINELFSENQLPIMILDDYQLIANQSIHSDLKYFIDHMPDRMHIVISTRIRVPFSIGRLRVRNQLAEIDTEDLRFTRQEISTFVRKVIGRGLSDDDISELVDYSEGWAAGLRIAVTALKNNPGNVPLVTRGHAHMIEYFMEEIFSSHPENIQTFLLQTSILESLNGPLCDAVTGQNESKAILETLCAGNMLIMPLDHEHYGYRYHALLAETLRERLNRLDKGYIHTLHSRASNWYLSNEIPGEAIHHAIEAQDWQHAAELVDKYAGTSLMSGEISTALMWMQSLPPKYLRSYPRLLVSYAWGLYLNKLRDRKGIPFDTIEQLLEDAQKLYAEQSAEPGSFTRRQQLVMGNARALYVYLAYEKGETAQNIIELCRRSLTAREGEFPVVKANLYIILGMSYMAIDEPEAAAKAFDEARSVALTGGLGINLVTIDTQRALLARLRGRLRETESICHESLDTFRTFIKQRRLAPEMLGLISLHQAAVLIERDNLTEAEKMLQEGDKAVRMLKDVFAIIRYHTVLAHLRTSRGSDLKDVFTILTEIGLMEKSCPGASRYSAVLRIRFLIQRHRKNHLHVQTAIRLAEQYDLRLSREPWKHNNYNYKQWYFMEQFTLIRLALAELYFQTRNRCRISLDEALSFLDFICDRTRQQGWGEFEIEGLMLKAMVHHARSEPDQTLAALERALLLAEPEGFVRLFVNEGEPMMQMLRLIMSGSMLSEYAGRLLEIIKKETKGKQNTPHALPDDLFNARIEPLSRQEIAVLKLVATGLSNKEIAEQLCIALTTVKTHNYNLFNKLNVKNRIQAVKKAHQLNLF